MKDAIDDDALLSDQGRESFPFMVKYGDIKLQRVVSGKEFDGVKGRDAAEYEATARLVERRSNNSVFRHTPRINERTYHHGIFDRVRTQKVIGAHHINLCTTRDERRMDEVSMRPVGHIEVSAKPAGRDEDNGRIILLGMNRTTNPAQGNQRKAAIHAVR